MCKSPIQITTRSKYINFHSGQQYKIWVNCGHCSECREAKQREWNVRLYYEIKKYINNGKWCYFDTLTYSNENLPKLTKYTDIHKNWACFNPKDIRYWIEELRQKLKGKKYIEKDNECGYMVVSEYGELRHRPHYHIILFINFEINEIELSKIVAEAWKFGRTDGFPWKSKRYTMEHNIIKSMNLNAMRYIAKYVTKQQNFIEIINKRWQGLERYYNKSKLNKLQIKKLKAQYFRATTPFHRQNQHFGEEAIYICKPLTESNIYYKDDSTTRIKNCGLPMYYKRKLLQKQIIYNGKRIWINTEFGSQWKQDQENKIIEQTYLRLKAISITKGIKIDDTKLKEIANYIIKERGRLCGFNDYKPHHEEAVLYNYNSDKDKLYLGNNFISEQFAGNDTIGYQTTAIEQINDDLNKYVTINQEYERIIEQLNSTTEEQTRDKELVLHQEKMRELKKIHFK